MIEKLVVIEQILLKSFLIGIALMIFSFLVYMFFDNQIIAIWQNFYGIKELAIRETIIFFYGIMKILIFVFFFVPLLGIYWTRKELENKAK